LGGVVAEQCALTVLETTSDSTVTCEVDVGAAARLGLS
jgi:hypothetical protein